MKNKYALLLIPFLIIFSLMLCINISAASGLQGYVVYRDGAGLNFDWHTAIVVEPNLLDYTYPILHTTSDLNSVVVDTWSNYLNGQEYIGLFTVNGIYTSSDRDIIMEDALWLTEYDIQYTLLMQMDYTESDVSGNYVMPRHISKLRCDGVVEYVFELNDFRIYGSDAAWDISYKSLTNKNEHALANVTPSKQTRYLLYCHDEIY